MDGAKEKRKRALSSGVGNHEAKRSTIEIETVQLGLYERDDGDIVE